MFKYILPRLKGNQKGITGIETAIILIAFVMVAAVFAYVVLSAGLFSSQKSQEAVYDGLRTTQNTIEIRGSILATAENTGSDGYLSQITFTIGNVLGSETQDFTPPLDTGTDGLAPDGSEHKVVISYLDKYQKVDDIFYTVDQLGKESNDYLLDQGELYQITIGSKIAGQDGGNLVDCLTHHLGTNTRFCIEIKPPKGSTLAVERTTPAHIESVLCLY
jgi:archaeal flagellin FlaB